MDPFDDDLHQEIRAEDIFSVLVLYIRKSIITAQADLTILSYRDCNVSVPLFLLALYSISPCECSFNKNFGCTFLLFY